MFCIDCHNGKLNHFVTTLGETAVNTSVTMIYLFPYNETGVASIRFLSISLKPKLERLIDCSVELPDLEKMADEGDKLLPPGS